MTSFSKPKQDAEFGTRTSCVMMLLSIRSCVLQQRTARGDEGRRQDCRPQRPPHHQRARRGRTCVRADKEGLTRRFSSSISAAARSTCPCSSSARRVEVKSTAGDNHLGGDNFDKAVVDWMAASSKRNSRESPDAGQDGARSALRGCGEGEKIELSSTMTPRRSTCCSSLRPPGPKHLDLELTRAKPQEIRPICSSAAPSSRPSRCCRTGSTPRRSTTSFSSVA